MKAKRNEAQGDYRKQCETLETIERDHFDEDLDKVFIFLMIGMKK